MSNRALAEAYIAGWNSHDTQAVLAVLGPAGTYEDPMTGAPIGGPALKGYIEALIAAFPDLAFDVVSICFFVRSFTNRSSLNRAAMKRARSPGVLWIPESASA